MLIDSFDLIGAHIDRLRYEVFQNLFLSPMNTDLLRHAVATAPTVYGIETLASPCKVLFFVVATAPTVYGIETEVIGNSIFSKSVATAPTVYGIETAYCFLRMLWIPFNVATAPTVYGIET